jgi:hypothetical protein
MAHDPLQEPPDSKRAIDKMAREIKMPWWRFALLSFFFMGSISVAGKAVGRLHDLGQNTSDILWHAFWFAAAFTLVTTVARLLMEREDRKREDTIVDIHRKKRDTE